MGVQTEWVQAKCHKQNSKRKNNVQLFVCRSSSHVEKKVF